MNVPVPLKKVIGNIDVSSGTLINQPIGVTSTIQNKDFSAQVMANQPSIFGTLIDNTNLGLKKIVDNDPIQGNTKLSNQNDNAVSIKDNKNPYDTVPVDNYSVGEVALQFFGSNVFPFLDLMPFVNFPSSYTTTLKIVNYPV